MSPPQDSSWTFLTEGLPELLTDGSSSPTQTDRRVLWEQVINAIHALPLSGMNYGLAITRINKALNYWESGETLAARNELLQMTQGIATALKVSSSGLHVVTPDSLTLSTVECDSQASLSNSDVNVAIHDEQASDGGKSFEGEYDLDVHRDWNIAFSALEAGEYEEYSGQFIAILEGCVVGSGTNQAKLREEVAQRHGVRPERLVVLYIDLGETYGIP
jgi:hypothetical protein